MEAFQPTDLTNVEVAHMQSRSADLVSDQVTPVVALVTNAPARKQQGNVVVEDGIPAGPVGREGVPDTAAAVRSARSPAGKMSKVSGVKRKKVPTTEPSATPSAPSRRSPTVPFYGAASTAREVFDERAGRECPSKQGSFTDMDEDEDDDGSKKLNKLDNDKKTKEKIKREHEASTLRDNIDSMMQSNEVLLAKSLEAKIELAKKKAREKQER
ncbi:Lactation elevated protein 1 [Hordeum vulgare]|nr:Lactation elevated protein 1 [Hordeum vulgare]